MGTATCLIKMLVFLEQVKPTYPDSQSVCHLQPNAIRPGMGTAKMPRHSRTLDDSVKTRKRAVLKNGAVGGLSRQSVEGGITAAQSSVCRRNTCFTPNRKEHVKFVSSNEM